MRPLGLDHGCTVTASTATSTTSTIVVATASTAALRREHLSDQARRVPAEHLERLGFLAAPLGARTVVTGAIPVGISLHLHDITHRCAAGRRSRRACPWVRLRPHARSVARRRGRR